MNEADAKRAKEGGEPTGEVKEKKEEKVEEEKTEAQLAADERERREKARQLRRAKSARRRDLIKEEEEEKAEKEGGEGKEAKEVKEKESKEKIRDSRSAPGSNLPSPSPTPLVPSSSSASVVETVASTLLLNPPPTLESASLACKEAERELRKDRERLRRLARACVPTRCSSALPRMFAHHVGGQLSRVARKSNVVDFGIMDANERTHVRAIQAQNLTPNRAVIVVHSHSPYFRCDQRFYEVGRKGTTHIRIAFTPQREMDGLVCGQLEIFFQDSSHTIFNLQAFVGQPLQFALAPRAFFTPAMLGHDASFAALAYNRSPYALVCARNSLKSM
jgi:hypothetical protein